MLLLNYFYLRVFFILFMLIFAKFHPMNKITRDFGFRVHQMSPTVTSYCKPYFFIYEQIGFIDHSTIWLEKGFFFKIYNEQFVLTMNTNLVNSCDCDALSVAKNSTPWVKKYDQFDQLSVSIKAISKWIGKSAWYLEIRRCWGAMNCK